MKRDEKQIQRVKKEDAALKKTIYWIVGAVVLELLLLLLNRYYVDYKVSEINVMLAVHSALAVLAVVFPVCLVASVLWAVKSGRAGKGTELPVTLAVVSAVLSAAVILVRFLTSGSRGVKVLYIAVPVVAVLAVVYYLYQREFFVNAVLCAAGIVGVWVVQHGVGGKALLMWAYVAVLAVLLAAVVLACRKMSAEGGVLALGGRKWNVFPKNANYLMTYVTCGLVAADVAACFLLGAAVAAMALYAVLVAWLLVLAVYYTVCLM